MRKHWLALSIVGFCVTLGAAVSSVCHVMQQADNRPVSHVHHSQKTLDAWAVWRRDHPDWKPKIKQTLAKLDFACGPVTTLDAETSELIVPEDVPQPPTLIEEEPGSSTIATVPSDITTTNQAPLTNYPLQPFYPYAYVPLPPTTTVSEVTPLWLVLTGLLLPLVRRRLA